MVSELCDKTVIFKKKKSTMGKEPAYMSICTLRQVTNEIRWGEVLERGEQVLS